MGCVGARCIHGLVIDALSRLSQLGHLGQALHIFVEVEVSSSWVHDELHQWAASSFRKLERPKFHSILVEMMT